MSLQNSDKKMIVDEKEFSACYRKKLRSSGRPQIKGSSPAPIVLFDASKKRYKNYKVYFDE